MVLRADSEERPARGASLLRGRPACHHPAAEPGRSQAHQNLIMLFFFSSRVRCVVSYSFGLEGAAWLSRVRRGLEGAAWLSRLRRGLEGAAWLSRVRRGLQGAAWLSRVRRGLEGAAWLSRVRRGLVGCGVA